MKKIVKQILIEKGFILNENCFNDENSFLAERTKHDKFDFLTVMFLENNISREAIKEKSNNYLLKIIEDKQTFIGVEKNLTLLVIFNVDSTVLSNEMNSLMYDLEEDPYDFKKYVMVYTQEQEALFSSELEASGVNITSFINQFINDPKKFSKFKNKNDSNDKLIYDMVSKLFIKLPFLSLENNMQILPNLYQEIVEGLAVEDKNTWDTFMELRNTQEGEPKIEEILACIGVDSIE